MKKSIPSLFIKIAPETRCFSIKRSLLRLVGYEIGHDVRVCSSARFLGAGHIILKEGTWIGHESMLVSTSLISVGAKVDIAPKVYIGTGTHIVDPVGKERLDRVFPKMWLLKMESGSAPAAYSCREPESAVKASSPPEP